MIFRAILLAVFAIGSSSLVSARELSLGEIVSRATARVVTVREQAGADAGSVKGTGYIVGNVGSLMLVVTARHTVAPVLDANGALPTLQWANAPNGCPTSFAAASVHSLSRANAPAFDVAVIVGDARCAPDLLAVPSAWSNGEPIRGSRFHALRVRWEEPVVDDVGPFWFADRCLPQNTCIDRRALVLETQGTTEAGMSGSPVLTGQGIAGIVQGADQLAAWPSVEVTADICAGLPAPSTNGFDPAGLVCVTAPDASSTISPSLAKAAFATEEETDGRCDRRIGKALRDPSEIGSAYKCRIEYLTQDWAQRSADLNCSDWTFCRDFWFSIVRQNGFSLGVDSPQDWLDLQDSLGLHRSPLDLVLAGPEHIHDFRDTLESHGFHETVSKEEFLKERRHPLPACTVSKQWNTFVHSGAKSGDLLGSDISASGDLAVASIFYGGFDAPRLKYLLLKEVDRTLQVVAVKESGDDQNIKWAPGATLNSNYLFVVALPSTYPNDDRPVRISTLNLWKPEPSQTLDLNVGIDPGAFVRVQQGWLAYVPPQPGEAAQLLNVSEGNKATEVIKLRNVAGRPIGGPAVAFNGAYLAVYSKSPSESGDSAIDIFKKQDDGWHLASSIVSPREDILIDLDISSGRLAILIERSGQGYIKVLDEASNWQQKLLLPVDVTYIPQPGTWPHYELPRVRLLGDLAVIGDPRWTDSNDYRLGAIHVVSFSTLSFGAVVTVLQEHRRGWDSFGENLAVIGNTVLASNVNGLDVNTGEIVAISAQELNQLVGSCHAQ